MVVRVDQVAAWGRVRDASQLMIPNWRRVETEAEHVDVDVSVCLRVSPYPVNRV